jgi:hypothetical protein
MTEKIVPPSDLHPQQINILLVSAVRALIRKGLIQKEELLAEVAQQGVPEDWAFLISKYVEQLPIGDNHP